jgi:hypothetical protein
VKCLRENDNIVDIYSHKLAEAVEDYIHYTLYIYYRIPIPHYYIVERFLPTMTYNCELILIRMFHGLLVEE